MPDILDSLYTDLKSQGYLSKDRETFRRFMMAQGDQGYQNRKALYDDLKSQGYLHSPTYEDFRSKIMRSVAEGGGQPKPVAKQPVGSSGSSGTNGRKIPAGFGELDIDKAKFGAYGTTNPSVVGDAKRRREEAYGKDVAQRRRTEQTIKAVKGDREAAKEVGTDKVGQQLRDRMDYTKATGNDLKHPVLDETSFGVAPTVARDEQGNIIYGENGKPLIGSVNDEVRANTQRVVQERNDLWKATYEQAQEKLASLKERMKANGEDMTLSKEEHIAKRNTLKAAYDEQQRLIEALEDEAKGGHHGYLDGLWDAAKDADTWLLGLNKVDGIRTKLRVSEKVKSGEALTTEEQELLDATIENNAVRQRLDEDSDWLYRAGRMTTEMLPFMGQIILTGGWGGVAAVGERMGQKWATKYAQKFGEKALLNRINMNVIRGLGIGMGDVAAGFVSANTTGAVNTLNDAMERRIGNLGYDEKGNYQFTDDEDWLRAIMKAEVSQTKEFATERFGEHLIGLRRLNVMLAKQGPTARNIARALSGFAGTKAMRKTSQWLRKGGINGVVGEVLEEEIGLPVDVAIGDMTWEQALSKKTQGDIVGGMLLSLGSMHAVGLTAQGAGKVAYTAQYYRYKNRADKADKIASFRMTADKWQPLKEQIDGTTSEDMNDLWLRIVDDGGLSVQEKRAAYDYINALTLMRGYNMGMLFSAREAARDNRLKPEQMTAEEAEELAVMNAEDEGRSAVSADEKKQMVDDWVSSGAGSEEPEDLESRLKAARAQGVFDAAQEGIELRVAQENTKVRENSYYGVNGKNEADGLNGNDADGRVIQVGIADRTYYVVGGDIQLSGDQNMTGTGIDVEASGAAIVVKDAETGEIDVKSPQQMTLLSVTPTQQMIDYNENVLRQQLTEQADNDITFGSPKNEVFAENDEVTLNDGNGGTVTGVIWQTTPEGAFLVEISGRVAPFTADELNRRIVAHNGQNLQAFPEEDLSQNGNDGMNGENGNDGMTEIDDAMPMVGEGEDAEPDFSRAAPDRAHRYIFDEAGLTRDEGRQFVEANQKSAEKELERLQKKAPTIGTSIAKYRKEQADWQSKVDAAQQQVDYWNSVAAQEADIVNQEAEREFAERQQEASGRQSLLDEQRDLQSKMATAKKMYGEYFDDDLTVPHDVMELVAMNMPRNISWEGREGVRGLQQELGLRRGIGRNADSNAFNAYLAKKGEGIGVGAAVHSIWESDQNSLPDGEKRFDDQEIRNALLDMFMGAEKPSDIRDYVVNSRIADAESVRASEDEAQRNMLAEWAEALHLEPEEMDAFEAYMQEPPTAIEEEYYNTIYYNQLAENYEREQNLGSKGLDRELEQGAAGTGTPTGEGEVREFAAGEKEGEGDYAGLGSAAAEVGGRGEAVSDDNVVGGASGRTIALSDEVDEHGRQFVLNSKGDIAFGQIEAESGLPPAPILLSEGMITNPETNAGYGLVHIEARHGEQIRNAGYASVVDFIEEVAQNYDVIRKGGPRDGVQTYMLQLTDKHNNTLMVELSGDGTYWNINTAGIFKTSYGANREVVYNRHTTAKQSAETAEASLSGEQSGTAPSTRMNAPTQLSEGKGTDNISNGQEKSGKNVVQGLEGYDEGEILNAIRGDIEIMLDDAGLDGVTIKGMALNGSRKRGDGREGSDLDVVVEYEGDISEDGLFNILNENPIEIEGIRVDVNPITKGKSGTLEEYMKRSRAYDEEKLAATEPQPIDIGDFGPVYDQFRGKPKEATVLEKKNSALDNTTDTGKTSEGGKRNDTATPQSTVSEGKGTEKVSTAQEKSEKSDIMFHMSEAAPSLSKQEAALRDALIDVMVQSGLEVSTDWEEGQRILDAANGRATLNRGQKRAMETASVTQDEEHQHAVISSVESRNGDRESSAATKDGRHTSLNISDSDGAKVLKNIGNLAKNYEEKSNQPRTFIKDVSETLGATGKGSSKYASFVAKNGKKVTIRLSNHNATVMNFDNAGEDNGISVVISGTPNTGIKNNGEAHIVEFFYPEKKLRKAEDKVLVSIIRSIEQSLYSGEYKDTTGLAEREEVNAEQVRLHKVFHGSGTDFERFDHSHMGEGEGAQAYGWGTYVTEVEGIGRSYAEQGRGKYSFKGRSWQKIWDGERTPADMAALDVMERMENLGKYATFEEIVGEVRRNCEESIASFGDDPQYKASVEHYREKIAALDKMKESDFSRKDNILYTVEIPDDAANVEKADAEWNQQLDYFADHKAYMFDGSLRVGDAGEVLKACGLPSDTELLIKVKTLKEHLEKHGLTVGEIRNLPSALRDPLLVYEWGTKAKSLIAVTELETNAGRKITAAIKLERNGKQVEVNEIASIHGKEAERMLGEFINEDSNKIHGGLDKAIKYVKDKEKVLDWLGLVPPSGTASVSDQGLSVAKVIKDFENPKISGKKVGRYLDYDGEIGSDIANKVDEALSERIGAGLKRQETSFRNEHSVKYVTDKGEYGISERVSGGGLYSALIGILGSDKAASEFLHDIGFTGIKYPADYRSGGRSDGAKNYVIFDENDLKITDKIRFFRTGDGQAYGFTLDGKIHIDPRIATAETPIHEYGHLWAQALRRANPEAWESLKGQLLGERDVMEYVTRRYPELEGDELMEEVFTHYGGKRGAERLRSEMQAEMDKVDSIFDKAKIATMFGKIRRALRKFWTAARDLFAGHNERLKDYSAADFADMAMNDLLRGFDPRKEEAPSNLPPLGEATERGVRSEKGVKERTLMGVHNISEEKLKKVIKAGGLANPSLAVIDTKTGSHTGYGNISLIPKSSLIATSTGKNAGTYTGDAYTPKYPYVERVLTDRGHERMEQMAKDAAHGDKELESHLRSLLRDYTEGNGSRLHLLYLIDKGMNPEIKQKSSSHTHEEYEALKRIFPDGRPSRGEITKEQNDALLELMMKETVEDAPRQVAGIKDEDMRKKAEQALIKMERERIADADGNLYFSKWDTFYGDVMRGERLRQNPQVDWYGTDLAADNRISTQGMGEDYQKWKDNLFSDEDFAERLFAGYTPSGNRRYVPNTVENASRLMNKESDTNANDESGLNATRSSLLKRMKTLSDIRKHRHLLQGEDAYNEKQKEMSDELYDIIKQVGDMQRIDDNPYINNDYAERRLQEAIATRDPIGHLNKEYGYNIGKDSELASRLTNFIEEAKNLPVRYFETKFKRPVTLDEFAVAVVPEKTSAEVVEALRQNGLDVRTYDNSDYKTAEENRKAAMMEAVAGRGDIMFHRESGTDGTTGSNGADGLDIDMKDRVAQRDYLLGGRYAASLNGNEFAKSDVPLTDRVSQFYADNYGGQVERRGFGVVLLDRRGVKDSLSHGIGRNKAAAFAAVPDIIKNGALIGHQENWKNRNYDSFTIAAPVEIAGEGYVGVVVVTRGKGTDRNKFYLHEVVLQKNLRNESIKTGTEADSHQGDVAKLLKEIVTAKENGEKVSGRDDGVLYRDNEETRLKAPNGADSNLSPEQWAQVRTKAFKDWFGDWEKAARVEKLRKSKDAIITGKEIAASDDLREYKKNALEYGKGLRGSYVNEDTGVSINIGKAGIKEVLQHDYKDIEQLQSVAAIPQIIENAIYIDSSENTNTERNKDVSFYHYYVCGLKIGGEDYTVRAVVAEQPNGERYYDHKLSHIEKGKLLDSLSAIANHGFNQAASDFGGKDTKLISILQTNSSKIVDENGEPMVMYHGTPKDFTVFDREKIQRGYGFWFTQNDFEADNYSYGEEEGDVPRVIPVFLNVRRPATLEDVNGSLLEDFRKEVGGGVSPEAFIRDKYATEFLRSRGYDGLTFGDKAIVYESNQIKSATENNGGYSSENPDIRFRLDGSNGLNGRNWSAREERQREAYARRQWRRAHEVADDAIRKLGLEGRVRVMDFPIGLTGRKAKSKGWYDPKTGKIVIVMNNHRSPEDVLKTILHEGVAHYGLRELFGKHFDDFLDNVYNGASTEIKESIAAKMEELQGRSNGANRSAEELRRVATEEYLAELAESTDFENAENKPWVRHWFNQIKGWFLDMLGKLGLKGGFADGSVVLTDNELRYILWRSYKNLAEPGRYRNPFAVAEDVVMRRRMGVEDSGLNQDSPDLDLDVAAEAKVVPMGDSMARMFTDFKMKYHDAMLLMKNGDGYVAMNNDAEEVKRLSGDMIRGAVVESGRVTFPAHELDILLARLVRAGNRVAIMDEPTGNIAREGEPELEWHGEEYLSMEEARERFDALSKKYHSAVPIVVTRLDGSDQELLEAFSIEESGETYVKANADSIRKIFEKFGGSYNPTLKKIIIFADELPSNLYEHTFFHENIHAVLDKMDEDAHRDITVNFWIDSPEEINGVTKAEIKDRYNRDEWYEEFFTDCLASSMDNGRIDLFEEYVEDLNEKKLFNNILKELGYDKERESQKRMDLRNASNEASPIDTAREHPDARESRETESLESELLVDDSSLFRDGEDGGFTDTASYDRVMQQRITRVRESWQDSMIPVKTIQDTILKSRGEYENWDNDKNSFEDAYNAENRMHGISRNEDEWYVRNLYTPLRNAFSDFMEYFNIDEAEAVRYMVSKTGLERNQFYAMSNAAEQKATEIVEKKKSEVEKAYSDGKLNAKDYRRKMRELSDSIRDEARKIIAQFKEDPQAVALRSRYHGGLITYADLLAELEQIRRKYVMRAQPLTDDAGNVVSDNYYDGNVRDYSGLTELHDKAGYDKLMKLRRMAIDEKDIEKRIKMWQEAAKMQKGLFFSVTEKAVEAVDTIEIDAAQKKLLDDKVIVPIVYQRGTKKRREQVRRLWDAVNASNAWTLKKSYDSGLISKENYQYISGMFDFYMPLRGWDDTEAREQYDYLESTGTAYSPSVVKTYGRLSAADHPLAYMRSMATSAIVGGNKNLMKQHFLRFAMNHPSNLVTFGKMWYERIGTNADGESIWEPRYPDIPENATADEAGNIVAAFNEEMRLKEAEGNATQHKGSLRVKYPIRKSEATEHHVEVVRNGETYVIYINGDPRAAQALNGSRRRMAQMKAGESSRIANVVRWMAANYTSKSPSFTMANLARDITMATTVAAIKEGPGYTVLLGANLFRLLMLDPTRRGGAMMPSLMYKYQHGTLDMDKPTERYFYEFMTYGGETGFTALQDIDDIKELMEKEFQKDNREKLDPRRVLSALGDGMEWVNRCIEDATRFATYMASRESGRGVNRSVNDAKNITLNFNRKGTGENLDGIKFLEWLPSNATVRNLYAFVNPAVQAMHTLAHLAKHFKRAFTLVTSTWVAAGVLTPLLNEFLLNAFGDDDDKEKYWSLPKWVRRNNFCLYIPGVKRFIQIPLAQEFRVFYGLGEIATTTYLGHDTIREGALDIVEGALDLLPLDFTGSGGNPVASLSPTLAKPAVDIALNTSFTGYPIWKETPWNKNEPAFQKAYSRTPSYMIGMSEGLNDWTGGNEHLRGWIERTKVGKYANNPAVWQHLAEGYFGGMYSFLSQGGGTLWTLIHGSRPSDMQIPVWNRFVNNPDDRVQSGQLRLGDAYYNLKGDADDIESMFSAFKKDTKSQDEALRRRGEEMMAMKHELDKKLKFEQDGMAYEPSVWIDPEIERLYRRSFIFKEYNSEIDKHKGMIERHLDDPKVVLTAEQNIKEAVAEMVATASSSERPSAVSPDGFGRREERLRKLRTGKKWQQYYDEIATYEDTQADQLLARKKKDAKERGDNVSLARIKRFEEFIREKGKKLLGYGHDEERMENIRLWRSRAIEILEEGEKKENGD